jgi:hypothetical protein
VGDPLAFYIPVKSSILEGSHLLRIYFFIKKQTVERENVEVHLASKRNP